jgi:hypothetical protein
MSSNQLPDGIYELFTQAEDMADGAHNHEAAVGLKQNKELDLRADLAPAIIAQKDYKTAISANTDLGTALTVADSNGKAFISAARRVLASNFGEKYNQSWAGAGFPDKSTAVPNTQGKREALLLSLKNFFTDNPSYEVNTPKLIVTAARADTVWTALVAARTAAKDGNTLAGQKKVVRDATEHALRDRMSGMIAELGQLLDDTDPLWLAFGLNEPGATNLPDSADALVLTAGPAGTVLAHWTAGSRSTRSRVFQLIVGVDNVPVNVKTVTEPETTLTGLPSGKTAQIYIVSANDAGQAAAGETVSIVVP